MENNTPTPENVQPSYPYTNLNGSNDYETIRGKVNNRNEFELQGQEIPQQQQPQQQAPMMLMPVQTANGIAYVPVQNPPSSAQYPTFANQQAQPFIPQQQPFVVHYQQPQAQPQPSAPGMIDEVRATFRNMTKVDKYLLWTKIVSVLSIIATIAGVCMLKKRKMRAIGFIVMFLMSLTTLLTFKIRKAIKAQDKKKFKCALKGFAVLTAVNVYNFILYMIFSRRCMFVAFLIIGIIAVTGSVARKGRRLFRTQLKAEWAGNQQQQN